MAASADDDWEPKMELGDWDHRLTIIGVFLAVGVALHIPCMTAVPYADVKMQLHGGTEFELGNLNLWRMDWDLDLLRRSGSTSEEDPTQWKYHVMHLTGFNRWHRNISDEIITMKLQNEGRLTNKTTTSWQFQGARTALQALRDVSDVFLYLQTGLTVGISMSICGLGILPIRTMRTSNQALMLCITAFVPFIITAVGSSKVQGHLPEDIKHIVPVAIFSNAVELKWRQGAHMLWFLTALYGVNFLFALTTHACTRNDPYPRGQGPNFPSAINGPVMPKHYYPFGSKERGPKPE